MAEAHAKHHDYHLVDPSPWPVTGALSAFAMAVGDGAQLLCDGTFQVTITAPEHMTVRLEVLDGEDLLGETTSADGVPATVRLGEQECFFSEARTLTARVSPIGSDRSGGDYTLARSGSF